MMTATKTAEVVTPEHVLEAYEHVRDITRTMLNHSRNGDWESLIDIEAKYLESAEGLDGLVITRPLNDEENERKAGFLEECLTNNGEISALLASRRDEVEQLIIAEQKRKVVHDAYHSSGRVTDLHQSEPRPADA